MSTFESFMRKELIIYCVITISHFYKDVFNDFYFHFNLK
jgi:hypothetical protein